MSDPSTLLLIACTSCGNDNYQDQYQDTSVHTAVEALDAKTKSNVDSHQSRVSVPETEPIAFASEVNKSGESLQTALAINSPASRPHPPELIANVSIAEDQQGSLSTSEYTSLRFGSEGEAVQQIQRQLRAQGYYQDIVDGIYGSQTARAVAQFQQSRGLKADGIFGLKTWQELNKSQKNSSFIAPQDPASSEGSKVEENNPVLSQETLEEATSDPQLQEEFTLDFSQLDSAYWLLLGWSGVYVGGWLFIVRGFRTEVSGFKYFAISEEEPDIHSVLSEGVKKPLSFASNRTSSTLNQPQSNGLSKDLAKNPSFGENSNRTPEPEPTLKVYDAPEITSSTFSRPQLNKTFGKQSFASGKVKKTALEPSREVTPLRPKDIRDYTLVAVIASKQKADQEGYTYSLVDDAEGRFVLKGTELFIPNQSLSRFEVENSYRIKIRRTDAQGSFVDKLFRVDVPREVVSA